MINCRLLHQLKILNEEKNYAKAARRLELTQPTLSRNIQSLEKQLGHRLIDRNTRQTQLTPIGQLVLHYADKVINNLTALENNINQLENLNTGKLNIGYGPYMAESSLAQTISEFSKRFPNVHLHVEIHDWEKLYEKLQNGSLDFFVAESSELEDNDDLSIIALEQHNGFFYCRSDHPLFELENLSLDDCLKYPLATVKYPARFEKHFHSLHQKLKDPVMFIECDSLSLNKKIVCQGDAIAVGTYPMLSTLLKHQAVKILPVTTKHMHTHAGIVQFKNQTLSPSANQFIQLALEIEANIIVEQSLYFKENNIVFN